MLIPLTFGVLLLLTAAMIVLRWRWWRLSKGTQTWLLRMAMFVVLVRLFFVATQWSLMPERLNDTFNWISVAGFELLMVRFSLMRPQWLSAPSAVILLLPIFGASLFFPLTAVFAVETTTIAELGHHYMSKRHEWEGNPNGNKGYSTSVFYRLPIAPVLVHQVQRLDFNVGECDASKAYVVADPEANTAAFHCPGHPGQAEMVKVLPLNPRGRQGVK